MNNNGWLIYFISFMIGIVSYLFCLITRDKKSITLKDYLFDGNSKYTSPISILGAFFSVAFLYSTLPTIYLIYGKSILALAIITSIIGFLFLRNKILNEYSDNLGTPSYIFSRANNSMMFFLLNFVYLFFVLLAEIAAFSYGIRSLELNDVWSPITVYMISALILIYVYIRGFRGVLITDIIQMGLLVFSLILLVFNSIQNDADTFAFPHSKVPNTIDMFWGWTACFVTGIAWIASAPEIWIRLTTLKQKRDVKNSLKISMIGAPFLFFIPLLWLNLVDVNIDQIIDISSTYTIWNSIINSSENKILSICFIMIVISAFFTTIDTFVITISQFLEIVKQKYQIINDMMLNKLRKFSLIICLAAILLGSYFPVNLNFVLGILAYNISIPIFLMIYLIPVVSKRYKVPRIPNQIFLLPLIASFVYVLYVVYPMVENGVLAYHRITLFTLFSHIITLSAYHCWYIFRRKND